MSRRGIAFLRNDWLQSLAEHGLDREDDRIVSLIILDSKEALTESVTEEQTLKQTDIAPLILRGWVCGQELKL